MGFFDLREPISALSHGLGMILALPVTWHLLKRSLEGNGGAGEERESALPTPYELGKALCLLVFGFSLIVCYANSALYHGANLGSTELNHLQRLDHVGIYFLIAGSYTPVTWSLMRGHWRNRTLIVVWSLAAVCSARVWFGGILPIWLSTSIYLTLGWGSLICYRELAKTYSHRTLALLPLGGMFYSIGAVINLAHWPAFWPGIFGFHELFHLFVLAGSTCHILFMMREVIPAGPPEIESSGSIGRLARNQGASVASFLLSGPHATGRPARARLLTIGITASDSLDQSMGTGRPDPTPASVVNPADA